MKRLYAIMAALATALVLTLPLFGQNGEPRPVRSLADLDRESAALAAQVKGYRGLPGAALEVGPFSSGGFETPLGNYWRQNLISQLAGSGPAGSGLTVLAPGGSVRGSAVLSGEIASLGRTVRIYTRLTDRSSSVVLASWTSDLERSPFMEGLLAIPSGGGSGPVSPDAWETDSRENPVEIAAGGDELQRTIHSGDRDWFVIRPAENALYILETSGSLDTMMELYEGSRRLAENDDGGRGDNALISYPLEAGKIYTVMIRGYGSDTGSYGFSVRTQEIPDRDREPNDSRGQATAVEAGSVTEGFIAPGDQDWYRFTLTEETSMIIRTRGRLDTLLALESAEAVLARDDDSGEGENARIIRKLGSGTYYVQVRGYDRNTSGPYTLELLVRSGASGADSWENDNAIEEAKPIALGETRRHTFTDGDDEDWAVFTAAEAGYYRISARGETDIDLDTELRLYFEDGGLVSEDDDGGEGYSSLIRRRLAPGRYYIRVSCLDDEPSDAYLLTVERE